MENQKPARHWRGYLKEYAIIVIGVLTALGAQQVADWLQWRDKVAQARLAMGDEMGLLMARGIERVRTEHCIEQRLDTIAAILDDATRKGALPPVPPIAGPPTRIWPDDVWQTTMASDAAAHFPPNQLNELGRIYAQVRFVRETNQNEQLVWANLNSISGPGRRLDPAADAALRAALSQARFYSRSMALSGGQVARRIGTIGLPYGPATKTLVEEALHRNYRDLRACEPLSGAAPAQYGQAQLDNYLNVFRDWQKYPPYAATAPRGAK